MFLRLHTYQSIFAVKRWGKNSSRNDISHLTEILSVRQAKSCHIPPTRQLPLATLNEFHQTNQNFSSPSAEKKPISNSSTPSQISLTADNTQNYISGDFHFTIPHNSLSEPRARALYTIAKLPSSAACGNSNRAAKWKPREIYPQPRGAAKNAVNRAIKSSARLWITFNVFLRIQQLHPAREKDNRPTAPVY